MAGSRFIDLVTDAEEITQVRGIRSVVKRLCNDSLAYICGLTEWPFLWTTHWFQTVAAYETGTVSVTNGDEGVTGSGTTFTAAMVGRKIRFGSETGYYTIKEFSSATSIELDQVYTGTTDTGLSFTIYKDEYLLRADLDQEKRIRQAENGHALFSLAATDFDDLYPSPSSKGVPELSVYVGRAVRTYSTGTVAMTSGDRTLTGSGTSWLSAEGLTRGTKIQIGTSLFTVNTVDTSTSLEVYESPTSNVSAGSSYVALLSNATAQLHTIPQDVLTYYYRYQRIPAIMDADNDVPDLPGPMHPLIGLRMLPTLWRHRGNIDRAIEAQNAFDKELAAWITKYSLPVLDRKYPLQPFNIQQGVREAGWPAGTGVILSR